MVINVRKLYRWIRLLLIFIVITFLLHQVILSIFDWIQPRYQYKKPYGKSLEVFKGYDQPSTMDLNERLYYYWQTGE